MPPKKEQSTGMNRNNATSTPSSSDAKSLPPPPKRSSLKSSNAAADGAEPSTSKQPTAKSKVTTKPNEDPSTAMISPTRSENYANRSKSIQRADVQRAKTAFLTMQMVDSQRRDLFLQITLKDIIFYIIFLILLSFMVLGAFNSSMYYLTRTVTESLITKQFYNEKVIPMNFMEITQNNEFFTYCDQILSYAFYDGDGNANKNSNSSSGLRLTKENILIGVPRLRQVRVKSSSCVLGYYYKYMNCFGEFSTETESSKAIFASNLGSEKYPYFSQGKLNSLHYQGKYSSYNGAGFIQNLGQTSNETKAVCQTIRKNQWISRSTRCVFLDFVVYNTNLNLFCIAKLVFEVPLMGGIIPSYSFTTVKLIRYLTTWDYFVRAAEWLCIGFIIFYTLEEMRELWYFRVLYLLQFWNYLDIVILCLGYTSIAYAVTLSHAVEDTFNNNLKATSTYANFEYVGKLQNELNTMLAILLFLAYIKIFKYLSFNKTFGQLNNTLQRCALDILAFSIMFFVVFFAYSELGYFLFGSKIEGFKSLGAAIITLLRTILGDFNYVALKNVHGFLAPIYFFSFIFVVFFVLLNMFLAIINDTYSEVKVELAVAPEEIQMSQFIKRGCFRFLEFFGCAGLTSETAKARNEYLITIEEIRGALKRSGFTDVEIRIFFNRYSIDPNGEKGLSSINTLLAELEESSLKSSTFDFQSAGLITIDDFLLQEEKLKELEGMITDITEKVDILLQKLDTIDSVRKGHTRNR